MRRILPYVLSALFMSGMIFSQMPSGLPDSGGMIIQVKNNLIENLGGEFSGTFQDSPVKDIFKIFAMQYSLNIMVSPNITTRLSANFQKANTKDAFLSILSANNLYYLVQGNIVKILTLQEYRNELLRQYIITKSYDASTIDVKNIGNIIKPVLSPGIGNFAIDSQSSKIIVSDIKDNFVNIDQMFEELSSLPKMAEIEIRIMQIDLNNENQNGINWSAMTADNIGLSAVFSPVAGISDELIKATGSKVFELGGQTVTADALISAIAKKFSAKMLSQPRVLAVNRKESSILIGSKVPYIKSIVNNTTTAQSSSQVEFIDVGIKLVVTPYITPDDMVQLTLLGELSSSQLTAITTTENAPQITTTEVHCEPIVKDNQTIIIGGLIKSELNKTKKGIPFLSDIPFLGDILFSHTVETVTKSEMVIFITPRIIRDGASNISLLNASPGLLKDAGFTNKASVQVTNYINVTNTINN